MNRSALITGGSRGIGRGIALALAASGWDVMINFAGRRDAAEVTSRECMEAAASRGFSIQAPIQQADMGQARDRMDLIESARKSFSKLDLLVNNAGITSIGRADILEAKEENFDTLMAVNLKGPFFLTQLAARWMMEKIQNQDDSSPLYCPKIINMASISAYTVSINRADYCMAKAALSMMTKLYAVRLAEHGIHVHTVCPGIIESDMTSGVKEKYDKLIADGLTPIQRWGKPEDIGKAVLAIAENRFPFSTGDTFHVDGGFHLRTL